jgi:hypothetical protein
MNARIGDAGAIALADVLLTNLPLEVLTLFQCGITQIGAEALLDTSPVNANLTHVTLTVGVNEDQDIIRPDTLKALRAATAANWDA